MSSEIESLCRGFCRALHGYTGGQLKEWRSIRIIGAQRGIYAPTTLKRIVAHGVTMGWLVQHNGEIVALTEMGQNEFEGEARILRPIWKR